MRRSQPIVDPNASKSTFDPNMSRDSGQAKGSRSSLGPIPLIRDSTSCHLPTGNSNRGNCGVVALSESVAAVSFCPEKGVVCERRSRSLYLAEGKAKAPYVIWLFESRIVAAPQILVQASGGLEPVCIMSNYVGDQERISIRICST